MVWPVPKSNIVTNSKGRLTKTE